MPKPFPALQRKGPDVKPLRSLLSKSLHILIGSVIYAIAISMFLDPNRLAPGGVSGIAIIISHFSSLPTGALIIAINIPLLLLGLFKLGWKTMLSTIVTVFVSSFFIDVAAAQLPVVTDVPLLAALFGGALLAVGMVVVFKVDSTTGGIDILVRVLRLKFPQIKSGMLFLVLDLLVVLVSGIVFQNIETALYAGLSCFVFSFVFDYLLYGGDSAKLIYLISDKQEIIVRRLLDELEVGATYLNGAGAYRGEPKQVLLCAMKNHLLPKAHAIILEEDPQAFLIIGQASEIFGEGFKDYRHPLL